MSNIVNDASTYRILACIIPLQIASMLAWAGYATRLPSMTQSADRIVVSKSHHTLTLQAKGQSIRTYNVALGRANGPKQQQGDHRTPEGHYVIDGRNPNSAFHMDLHVSYPSVADRAHALALHQPPGGDIEIHGLPATFSLVGRLHRLVDWTDGCIAVSNSEMEEIYLLVPNGTPIDIEP
jgi:murein L,D-transpeptidase YafK